MKMSQFTTMTQKEVFLATKLVPSGRFWLCKHTRGLEFSSPASHLKCLVCACGSATVGRDRRTAGHLISQSSNPMFSGGWGVGGVRKKALLLFQRTGVQLSAPRSGDSLMPLIRMLFF